MPHDHHDHPHTELPSEPSLRVKALESLLLQKQLINRDALDEIIDTYQNKIGPQNGAKLVAMAWTDQSLKQALLDDPMPVLQQLGFYGRQGEHMKIIENTDDLHNLVVCTLCSCYPWPLLGIPPSWYKSDAYRARAVREPRKVLSEFGVDLPQATKVRVWDSTAEIRYLVLPQRPAGTEGWDIPQCDDRHRNPNAAKWHS
jgi:nitrile hydratase